MAIHDGRQTGPTLAHIRDDHLERYLLAASLLQPGWRVLDIACGVGYGSYLMAERVPGLEVEGVDLAEEAIAYARDHYAHPSVRYRVGDALSCDLGSGRYDAAVCFETLEHIQDDRSFLERLHAAIRPGGRLILSTPNQDVLPFQKSDFPYHVRHYTAGEMESLLASAGFAVLVRLSQRDRERGGVRAGFGGAFNIAVCSRSAVAESHRETLRVEV